jgi:type VI secretion system protein ImpH
MAAETGPAARALEQRLKDEPARFDFFQAVRRLECAHAARARIGSSEHLREDPVRFCQELSLAFAPSAVRRYTPAGADHGARLFVSFMGLLGPNGPMPLPVSAYAYDREHNHGDHALARFLDLFNHRMISKFYRAWAASQQAVSRDGQTDRSFDRFVGSLFGAGMSSFSGGDSVPDEAKLHYSGRLSCQTRHAEGLAAVVGDYFKVPARVEQFVGRWMRLPANCRTRLGGEREVATLGATAVLGARVWECQQKFRLHLGPMRLADYERLLPCDKSFRRLVDWVGNYCGHEMIWDVRFSLRAAEVPRTRLGGYGRLGWTTWLKSRPFEKDAEDFVVAESRLENLRQSSTRRPADGRD